MNIKTDWDIDIRTFYARKSIEKLTKALEYIASDPQAAVRRSEHECPVCYYLERGSKIVGHGFTTYTCQECEKEHRHPNTGVPRLCRECAEAKRVCRRCGADIELKERGQQPKPKPKARKARR
jgi:hypothetical protein